MASGNVPYKPLQIYGFVSYKNDFVDARNNMDQPALRTIIDVSIIEDNIATLGMVLGKYNTNASFPQKRESGGFKQDAYLSMYGFPPYTGNEYRCDINYGNFNNWVAVPIIFF